jgi:outer membrane protein OmpA-like peptidoglycan-associated protein
VSILPSLVLPTGDKKKFFGEGQVIFQPTVAVDVELGRPGAFRIGVNGGLRMRNKPSTFTDDAASFPHPVGGVPANTNRGVTIGNEVLGGLGVSWGVLPNRFDVVGEFYTFIGLDSKKEDGSKIGPGGEAIAGVKLYLARNSFFMLGGGYGVLPTSYGTTQGRVFLGFIFEPSIGDRDGDGFKDDVDLCPDDPEDFDDFEDEDGCPEPDNDKDGILDIDDKCPNDPETYNGFEDDDGCPDKGKVIVRKGKLEILDKIYFETDKAEIKAVSFPLLDAIAATIKGNPQLQLLEIQGHADERGNDEHNLDLTERRSQSVREALVERGVNPGTLRNRGYGETKPICTQHNEDCWSQNRRVEFIILKRAEEQLMQGGEGQ